MDFLQTVKEILKELNMSQEQLERNYRRVNGGKLMKKKKSTDELTNEILSTADINSYIDEHNEDFIDTTFHKYLMEIIIEKALDNKEIIEKGNLNRVYFYHLLSGKRKPSRNKVLQLAFGLSLDLVQTQMLLKIAGMNVLYSKMKRDAIIIYAISNHITIIDTEILLSEEGEILICNQYRGDI